MRSIIKKNRGQIGHLHTITYVFYQYWADICNRGIYI